MWLLVPPTAPLMLYEEQEAFSIWGLLGKQQPPRHAFPHKDLLDIARDNKNVSLEVVVYALQRMI